MAGNSPAELGQLKSVDWDKLQRYADRLEEAWKQAEQGQPRPELKEFLPAADDGLRLVVLHELIKTELEIRWRHGLPTSLEHYLEKFPELGQAKDLPAALVLEEFRVRQQHGDKPPLAAYQVRFPDQFPELQKLQQEMPAATAALPTPPLSPPAQEETVAAAPQQTIASGGTVLPGGYKLLKRIGSGTFGEVWKAEAPGGVPCAVKIVIRPVDAEEAQRELHALELIKQLQHPFLMQTHRFETFQDRLYIVMELADGSLRDRLKQRRKEGKGGIPVPELLRYFRESAEALDFLHAEKVLHRDIKPENILLSKGHAKVADFGLARGQGSGASMFSATGCGTPAYMAPEVWRGKVSHHTDQYSLAVAYAELRLDRRLFAGSDFMQVMFNHLEKTPDLEPLGEPEKKVLLKALAKDPAQRYANCAAFIEALEEALVSELGRSTGSLRQPSPSVQQLAGSADSGMGTVGRGSLPTSGTGDRTEDWRPAGPEQRSFVRSLLLLLTIFVPVGAAVWYFLPGRLTNGPTPPTTAQVAALRLRALQPLEIGAGDQRTVQLHIDRANLTESIAWTILPPAPGLLVKAGQETGNTLALLVEANAEAEPGTYPVTIQARSGDLHDEQRFPVTVLALNTLPKDCQKAKGAKIVTDSTGKKFYDRIVKSKPGLSVPFVVVDKRRLTDPPTFYMMENKVSNQDLLTAMKDKGFLAILSEEAKKHPDLVKHAWRDQGAEADGKPLGSSNGQLPAMRLTVTEAHCFAVWLGGLLPTEQQWDKAAGLYEEKRGEGPYRGVWKQLPAAEQKQIAVNRFVEGPMEVGKATLDQSPFGCWDMAGNGREWTRNANLDRKVPLVSPGTDDSVKLRGWSWIIDAPLKYSALAKTPDSSFYVPRPMNDEPHYDIGCRVVLELQ